MFLQQLLLLKSIIRNIGNDHKTAGNETGVCERSQNKRFSGFTSAQQFCRNTDCRIVLYFYELVNRALLAGS